MAAQAKQVHGEIPGSGPAQILHVPIDTAELLLGWKKFFDGRREKHQSNVFRTAILFPAISILDIRGFRVLFDPALVKKVHPFGVTNLRRELVGTLPTTSTNGKEHEGQKQFVLEWLRRSVPRLLPSLQAATEPFLTRWEKTPPLDWGADADVILSNAIFDWALGSHPDPADLHDWIGEILVPVPFDDVPQMPASQKAVHARDRLVASVVAAPHFAEAAELASKLAGLSREDTAHQLLFYLGFNAWTGINGTWRSLMAELGSRSETQERVRAEAREAAVGWPGFRDLEKMETLRGALGETLRLHAPVPFAYGEAITDFHIDSSSGSFPVKTGDVLQGVFLTAGRDPAIFPDPDHFDPMRYRDPAQVEALIWANGLGTSQPTPQNKMCAGRDGAVHILSLFTARLASQYRWELAEQPEWDDHTIIPANIPKKKLALKSFERV